MKDAFLSEGSDMEEFSESSEDETDIIKMKDQNNRIKKNGDTKKEPENGNPDQSESQNPTLRTVEKDGNNESGNLVSQPDSGQNQSVNEKTISENATFHDISELTDTPREEIIPMEKDENDEKSERTMIVMPDTASTTEEKSENRENLADSFTKSETDSKSEKAKEMRRANLTMEPVAMNFDKRENIRPDLATSLRFMTEVYSTEDDEEIFETLSAVDIPTEMALAERANKVMNVDNYQGFQEKDSSNRSIRLTSSYMSGAFEPALTEEQKAALRPRNKFTKFFKSIKKKFVKKE